MGCVVDEDVEEEGEEVSYSGGFGVVDVSAVVSVVDDVDSLSGEEVGVSIGSFSARIEALRDSTLSFSRSRRSSGSASDGPSAVDRALPGESSNDRAATAPTSVGCGSVSAITKCCRCVSKSFVLQEEYPVGLQYSPTNKNFAKPKQKMFKTKTPFCTKEEEIVVEA